MKDRIVAILDVDQTLAGGVVGAHLKTYNRDLGLGMSDEQIEEANRRFPKTFDVPQIKEYRQVDEQRFQQVRGEIRTSAEVHLAFSSLPGSVEGVLELTQDQFEFGGYYTVRPTQVETATAQWLDEKGFPSPEKVVICNDHRDKLTRIANDHLQPDEQNRYRTVMLIDDSLNEIVAAANELVSLEPSLKLQFSHLIIVGFGKTDKDLEGTFHLDSGIRTLVLPNWQRENVQKLKTQFLQI